MSDTLFRGFIDALREADYKRSTIELYTTLLRESNVPLNDINAVRAKAKRILAEDFHGDIHRAFLCYSTFLDGDELPGGRGPNRHKTTLEEACLQQKTRTAFRQIVWLVNHHKRKYAVDTALDYVYSARLPKADMHGHRNRGRAALTEFPKLPWTPDFETSKMRKHYYSLEA